MRRTAILTCVASLVLEACTGNGACVHGENWPFKIGTDAEAGAVSIDPILTTIDALRAVPNPGRPRRRVRPFELTTYVLRDVELREYQRAPDGDVQMVLADGHGHTMIAEAAPPFCTAARSPWRTCIASVRRVVDQEIPMSFLGWPRRTISLAGVGYLDTVHGQPGVAPNGVEVHPIFAICFGRGCALPAIDTERGHPAKTLPPRTSD